jgi:hypothetical protein
VRERVSERERERERKREREREGGKGGGEREREREASIVPPCCRYTQNHEFFSYIKINKK